jgi:uncharacterized protein (DUF2235 family)
MLRVRMRKFDLIDCGRVACWATACSGGIFMVDERAQSGDALVTIPDHAGEPPKKIVIFADGTGNAYFSQESNVWRLYQALDKTRREGAPLQLARYIPGVGTSSNSVIRAVDGLIGFGVPFNVRTLYRFLCWNWCQGKDWTDEIHLFGFSRGAFTVRTLASLIASQGILPREIDGRPVTSAEMKRNALAAWRAYRTETAPLVAGGRLQMNPLISVVRGVRDGATWVMRKVFRQMTYAEVQAHRPKGQGQKEVAITFMGLFDTVEAYGLPVEELRRLYNWLIWPIQFRNRRCSMMVRKVRHALSADDERLTFHPLRFDQGPRPLEETRPDISEVWFAGVHSDVGGGYPNDEVAYEPLLWVADEARRQGLALDTEVLDRYRRRLYPQALTHDSRGGLASAYRYAPRQIEGGEAFGGAPVVHYSLRAKMLSRADGYAPIGLPEDFRVYPAIVMGAPDSIDHGLTRNTAAVAAVEALVGRRKATNWITISLVAAVVILPLIARYNACRAVPGCSYFDAIWGAVTGFLAGLPGSLIGNWHFSLPLVLGIGAIYLVNEHIGDRIRDWARQIWA